MSGLETTARLRGGAADQLLFVDTVDGPPPDRAAIYGAFLSGDGLTLQPRFPLVAGFENQQIPMVVYPQFVVRGQRLALTTDARVRFEAGSARLTDALREYNDGVAAVLLHCGPQQIGRLRIEGHSDNIGDHDANVRLTQRRAEAIAEDLVALGIPRERLEAVGYGPDVPFADNETSEGRAMNRRVEYVLVDLAGRSDVRIADEEALASVWAGLGCSSD